MSSLGVKTCPECAEEIKLEAKVCRYCGTTFSVVRVGYCMRCHKIAAASDLGVCVICGSRLIDVRLESQELSGPTIGAKKDRLVTDREAEAESEPEVEGKLAATAAVPAVPFSPTAAVVPVSVPSPAPEEETKPSEETEPEPGDEADVELDEAEPEPEPEAEPEAKAILPSSPVPAAPSPPPGPPPGVPWTKPTSKPDQIGTASSSDVAERLAAFGRRESAIPASGPVAPPSAPAPPVPSEPAPPESAPSKPTEAVKPEMPAGDRLGIVPSIAQRIAYPFYLLALITVLAIWIIDFVWDAYLKGTSNPGSATLADFVVATYDRDSSLLVDWQIGLIAIICALLIPTSLQPKGWFRQRGVAKDFSKRLDEQYGVTMLFAHRWYFHKLMLAVALWGIGCAYLVARVVRLDDFVIEMGGMLLLGAMLVAFACAAVLAVRRTPVVALKEDGSLESRS